VPRGEVIAFRCSPKRARILQHLAEETDGTLSSVVRQIINEALPRNRFVALAWRRRRSTMSSTPSAFCFGVRSDATRSSSTRRTALSCRRFEGSVIIESPETAQTLLDALPDDQRALWAVALFAGLRRGELLGLRWVDVDFAKGVIRVERGWDLYAGVIAAKSSAAVRSVPTAFPVRRELRDLKLRSGRDGEDLVFGRTATEPFFPSTIRSRANAAWKKANIQPMTLHEARHCAISFFIASGLDLKQVSTWAGHSDIRVTLNRYAHLIPGSERDAADRLSAYLSRPTVAQTVAQAAKTATQPGNTGSIEYRYRDSNPGFRRERAAS
jgi:integrase